MKRYWIAEWQLYKKNMVQLVVGFVVLFIYLFCLLFSGVFVTEHVGMCMILAFLSEVLFLLPLYYSPIKLMKNRTQVCVTMEQLVLTLGEDKRTFLKIRLAAWGILYGGFVLLTAVMQLPAALIGGKGYQPLYFGLEFIMFSALFFIMLIPVCLVPHHKLMFALPMVAGFGGGLCSGSVVAFSDKGVEALLRFWAWIAGGAFVLVAVSFFYRYRKTIREERR